jgi:hypothetical protein
MKDRALYHLLMLSGRSVRSMVPSTRRGEVDAICATLTVDRPGRGHFVVRWETGDEMREQDIVSSRFTFYARGDVGSIVERRAPDLDLRKSNWLEAHRVWGELLDLEELRSTSEVPGRVPPTVADDVPFEASAVLVGVIALISGSLPIWASAPVVLLAGVSALVVTLLVSLRAAPWMAVATAVLAVITSVAVEPSGSGARSAVAGLALILAATHLVPAVELPRSARWFALAAAGTGGALAAISAPQPAIIAAVVLVGIDLAACMLRDEPRRALRLLLISVTVAAAGVALEQSIGGAVVPAARLGDIWHVVIIVATVMLAAWVAMRTTEGTRDRLSLWLAPGALAADALADGWLPQTAPWAVAAIGAVTLAVHRRWRNHRRGARDDATQESAVIAASASRAPQHTPVTFRPTTRP